MQSVSYMFTWCQTPLGPSKVKKLTISWSMRRVLNLLLKLGQGRKALNFSHVLQVLGWANHRLPACGKNCNQCIVKNAVLMSCCIAAAWHCHTDGGQRYCNAVTRKTRECQQQLVCAHVFPSVWLLQHKPANEYSPRCLVKNICGWSFDLDLFIWILSELCTKKTI